MKLKANFMYKPGNLQMDDCQVEKVVELSTGEFFALVAAPLADRSFIAKNRESMFSKDGVAHCLLALGHGHPDGVLINSEGCDFARRAAYLTGARDIVNARLKQAADYIVRQGVENTRSGSWDIHIDELEQLGLTIREGSGLDMMLLDTLERREEVSDAYLIGGCITTSYYPRFCRHQRQEEASRQFSPERTAELFGNAMTAITQRYSGDELYAALHDDFGLTLREIRDHGYLADSTLTEVDALPRQALENVMRVRDILQVDTPSETFLTCGPEHGMVPLEFLTHLTEWGRQMYAAILDAEVADIRDTDEGLELTLGGLKPEELDRFAEDYMDFERADDRMTMSM